MKKTIFVLVASLFASSVFAQSFSAPAATSDRTVDPARVNTNRGFSEPAATSVPGAAATSVPGAVNTLPSPNTVNRPLAPQPNNQQPAQNQITDRPVEPGNPTVIQSPSVQQNLETPRSSITSQPASGNVPKADGNKAK